MLAKNTIDVSEPRVLRLLQKVSSQALTGLTVQVKFKERSSASVNLQLTEEGLVTREVSELLVMNLEGGALKTFDLEVQGIKVTFASSIGYFEAPAKRIVVTAETVEGKPISDPVSVYPERLDQV